jgi:hypothetical protein
MLKVDKEQLKRDFNSKNYNAFFKQAYYITDFVCGKTYNIRDPDIRADYVQECITNLHCKIIQGKVDGSKNLFSFIIQNSNYRILEIMRKERKRNKKVKMISYNILDDLHNVIDFEATGEKYLEDEYN